MSPTTPRIHTVYLIADPYKGMGLKNFDTAT
jgi:hypothetical protein